MTTRRIHENSDRQQPTQGVDEELTGAIHDLKDAFGFIRPDGEGQPDHFFHKADLARESRPFYDLRKGARCRFTSTRTERGPRAVDVVFD